MSTSNDERIVPDAIVSGNSMDDVINVYKKDVDRTLLRENLKLTVDERIRKFESVWVYAAELRSAGQRSRTKRSQNGAKLS